MRKTGDASKYCGSRWKVRRGSHAALIAAQPDGAGRKSICAPFREAILAKLDQSLSAMRIHQDLTREQGAAVSYHSVRRFVRRLEHRRPLPFRRRHQLNFS